MVWVCALDEWSVAERSAVGRSAAPFAGLSDGVLASVLDLLSGRYPSEEFAELRPRIVWAGVEGTVRGRSGAQRLAVTHHGTITDSGLCRITLHDGTRAGARAVVMVYAGRPEARFRLAQVTWRVATIPLDRNSVFTEKRVCVRALLWGP